MAAELLDGLDRPPRRSLNPLWADYVELRCLVHPDHYFTLDGTEEALHEADDYSADSENSSQTSNADGLDKLSAKWAECERIIERRATRLGDAYPFAPSTSFQGIELRTSGVPELQNWYKFLLLASSLRYVPNHNNLTSAFERASHAVFAKLHSENTEVHGFWPGAHHYPNDKQDRLNKLAEDLKAVPQFSNTAFNANDRGDGGIDLVAWHPLGDERNRIPIALGQCGCSVEDWKTKPLSVTPFKLNSIIFIPTSYLHYYFMPLDMAGFSDNQWADGTAELPSTIVIDRFRFMNLVASNSIALPSEAVELIRLLDGFTYR